MINQSIQNLSSLLPLPLCPPEKGPLLSKLIYYCTIQGDFLRVFGSFFLRLARANFYSIAPCESLTEAEKHSALARRRGPVRVTALHKLGRHTEAVEDMEHLMQIHGGGRAPVVLNGMHLNIDVHFFMFNFT